MFFLVDKYSLQAEFYLHLYLKRQVFQPAPLRTSGKQSPTLAGVKAMRAN